MSGNIFLATPKTNLKLMKEYYIFLLCIQSSKTGAKHYYSMNWGLNDYTIKFLFPRVSGCFRTFLLKGQKPLQH